MQYDYLVDATGEACPMPLLKAKMQLNKMQPGECLKVVATDAGSMRDFVSFIELTNHELLQGASSKVEQADLDAPVFVYYIVKH